jgi:hypothetical protein
VREKIANNETDVWVDTELPEVVTEPAKYKVFVTEKINDDDREIFSEMKRSLDNRLKEIPAELISKVFSEDQAFSLIPHQARLYVSMDTMSGAGEYKIAKDCEKWDLYAGMNVASADRQASIRIDQYEQEALDGSRNQFALSSRGMIDGEDIEESRTIGSARRNNKGLTVSFSEPDQHELITRPNTQLSLQTLTKALKDIENGVRSYSYFLYPSSIEESETFNMVQVEEYQLQGTTSLAWLLKTVEFEFQEDNWERSSHSLELLTSTGVSLHESFYTVDDWLIELITVDMNYLEDKCSQTVENQF